MLAPMGALIFAVSPDRQHHSFVRGVAEGTERDHLDKFIRRQPPYAGNWIEVDGLHWIRRSAIVSVQLIPSLRDLRRE